MSWPTCPHGYFQTPGQHCPWCAGEDTSAYVPVAGKGNGWLLGKDDLVCDGCGGPRSAGWGAWAGSEPPTPENVREALSTMRYCYTCVRDDGKMMKRSSKRGEFLTDDEMRVASFECPDCGKRYVVSFVCPRLTCGSRFEERTGRVIRITDAAPDRPPPKRVTID